MADIVPNDLDAQFDQGLASLPNTTQQAQVGNPSQQLSHPDTGHTVNDSVFDQYIQDSPEEALQKQYGTGPQQALAGVEGIAQGFAGPTAPLAEAGVMRVLGQPVSQTLSNIEGREKANPGTHYSSEAGGLAASMYSGVGEGRMILQAGSQGAKGFSKLAGEGLAAKIGAAAAEGAISNALVTGGDEVTKMILNDPEASVSNAVNDVGLSALIGGGIGGALGSVSPLWKAVKGVDAGQTIADFKGRMAEHIANPDPVASMTDELTQHYNNLNTHASEVYGANGLKAQDIAKVMPEMNDKIATQGFETADKLDGAVSKLGDDPHASLLDDGVSKYKQALSTNDPSQIFNATQDLKQQLQEYGKFNKDMVPLNERPFRNVAKNLAFDLRDSLEDTSVWGQAAERQTAINKGFSNYLPELKNFESKFTEKLPDGSRQVSPGKVQTYLNQIGNPNAEIKQSILRDYLDASDKYSKVIADTHTNLGLDSPLTPTSMNITQRSLGEQTTGMKLADIFVKKGLGDSAGKGIGAAIGAGLGHIIGHGELGAIVGGHALGPLVNSVLHAIAKPMLETAEVSGAGLRAGAQYGASVSKGLKLATDAAKNVFKAGTHVLPNAFIPNAQAVAKLDTKLQDLQKNPQPLYATLGQAGHYMPNHVAPAAAMASKAVQYLNAQRPVAKQGAPLDPKIEPSKEQKSQYNRTLALAQQPLSILQHVKDGTVNSKDLMTVKTIYPALYNQLTQQLTNEMTNHLAKDGKIDYRTRMGLSLFAGQPLDSTMKPEAIQAAQPSPPAPNQPQGSPQPGKSQKISAKAGTGLGKLSQSYQTQQQAAEADQAKR